MPVTNASDMHSSPSESAIEKDADGNFRLAAFRSWTRTVNPTATSASTQQVSALSLHAALPILGISPQPGHVLEAVTLTFTVPTGDSFTFTSSSGLNQTFTAGANQSLTQIATPHA